MAKKQLTKNEIDKLNRPDLFEEMEVIIEKAYKKHGDMNSFHEAYAVILEELDEFWDEVKKKQPDKANSRTELLQIAAMCIKTIESLDL